MASQQLRSTPDQLWIFALPPSPFPGAPGSPPSGEGDCRSNEMGSPVEEQQQQQEWGFHGSKGVQGCHKAEMDGQGVEEYGKDHENGPAKFCARGHWRPAEDAKLKELVSQYGPLNWNMLAEKLEGRSGKSCRLRWFNQLDPRINRTSFGEEEEERLLAAHRHYGNKWALIARLFPGRTDNAVKNHWHVIMARRQREQSSGCRRGKPSPYSPALRNRVEMRRSHNACSGESTITTTTSKCTAPGAIHGFLTSYNPTHHPLSFEPLIGSDEKLVAARNGGHGRFGDSGGGFHHGASMVLVTGFDQPGYSDSNSEASTAESVADHKTSISFHGGEREKISLPFIDFLGVGAT